MKNLNNIEKWFAKAGQFCSPAEYLVFTVWFCDNDKFSSGASLLHKKLPYMARQNIGRALRGLAKMGLIIQAGERTTGRGKAIPFYNLNADFDLSLNESVVKSNESLVIHFDTNQMNQSATSNESITHIQMNQLDNQMNHSSDSCTRKELVISTNKELETKAQSSSLNNQKKEISLTQGNKTKTLSKENYELMMRYLYIYNSPQKDLIPQKTQTILISLYNLLSQNKQLSLKQAKIIEDQYTFLKNREPLPIETDPIDELSAAELAEIAAAMAVPDREAELAVKKVILTREEVAAKREEHIAEAKQFAELKASILPIEFNLTPNLDFVGVDYLNAELEKAQLMKNLYNYQPQAWWGDEELRNYNELKTKADANYEHLADRLKRAVNA